MMFRISVLALWILTANVIKADAQEAEEPTTENTAATAKQQFDQLLLQWQAAKKEVNAAYNKKIKSGDPDGTLAKTIFEKQKESDVLLDQIVAAGLEVYQQDSQSYPNVNKILIRLAGFYVIGDRYGDGGDQYEKALPVIRKLLEAGAGENEQWTDLWVWGGASAYCLHEFDLAEEYLKEAQKRGLFEGLPPQPSNNLAVRIRQMSVGWLQDIPKLRLRWNKERGIRQQEASADNLPRVKLVTTKGEILLELFENEAPQSVANFLTLVKKGFYNNITFHRVLPMFMAQGGCPLGEGYGGPGYRILDEHTLPRYRRHFRGSLSMAHSSAPNTGGSQFFLTFVPTKHLDGRHAVFGRVVEGIENAAALKRRDPGIGYLPEPDRIISAEVLRDRGHGYKFDKIPE